MTVHVMFTGGPLDGEIHTYQDPEDVISIPFEIEHFEESDLVIYADYQKVRVTDPPKESRAMRGKQGLWVFRGRRYEEVRTDEQVVL